MGRAPCCDKANVKKGPWSPEEDAKLKEFIHKYGPAANWIALPQKAGLKRCGKSCRLRWLNYLRPNIKHGEFTDDEDKIICTLYATIGSRWSVIASQLPGRTDNDIKNYWNTKLKKKLLGLGIIPSNQVQTKPPFSFPLHFQFQTSSTPHPHPHPLSLSNFYSSYDQPRKSLSLPSPTAAVNLNPQNIFNFNTQNEGLADFHGYYPIKDNMLVFGRSETTAAAVSCSSSDGSCSQISYGGGNDRPVKNEEVGFFQGFVENRSSFEDPLGSILDHHKQRNGVLENNQLQYDLEEAKQLITDGGGGLVFGDENKDAEMGMFYF